MKTIILSFLTILTLAGCDQPPVTRVTPSTQRFELVSDEITNGEPIEIYKDRKTGRQYLSFKYGLTLMPEENLDK